jgi:hypothetical protein
MVSTGPSSLKIRSLEMRMMRQPRVHVGVASFVVGVMCITAVLLAIELDDQPGFRAREVGDVGADRMLAAEGQAVDAPVAQTGPEDGFRFRHAQAEGFGEGAGSVRVFAQVRSPLRLTACAAIHLPRYLISVRRKVLGTAGEERMSCGA